MSLRPEIVGFDLTRMRSHFGSKSQATIEHVTARLERVAKDIEQEDKEEADKYRTEARATIQAIVTHGVPIKGLKFEEDVHFDVASVLAMHEQSPHDVQSNGWKMGAFWEFQRAFGKKLDRAAQPLLEHLISGRPLFAPKMEIDWSYYAYLTQDEVNTLLTALRTLQTKEPQLAGPKYLDGFVDTLIGWLAAIHERRMDLWLYAV